MIPKYEMWIDRDFGEPEYKYYIPHMIKEWELMDKGKSYKTAITVADKLEQKMRNDDEKKGCKIEKLEDIDGCEVWLVNGKTVRNNYNIDFTEGGHDKVYDFVPPNEIWISDEISAKERPYILAHEYNERCDMAQGEDYDSAHNKASFFERKLRHKFPNFGQLRRRKNRHKPSRYSILSNKGETTLSKIK